MFFFPKEEYIGRSIQRKRNFRDRLNRPIIEKYAYAIENFLLCGTGGRERKAIRLEKSSKKPNFCHVLEEKNLNVFGLDELKLPSCKNRMISMIERKRKHCFTPGIETSGKRERYRAKSVQLKEFGKRDKVLQTDEKVIVEDESQDEESPEKFKPIYS